MAAIEATFAPRPEVVACFSSPDLFNSDSDLTKGYVDRCATSTPYKHSVVRPLLDDDLLRAAREEIKNELSFTEKETDIYKVNQTGDLANLDGLPLEEQERLKNVMTVRNALFSKEFRSFIQRVTGCGPLSEKKKDMSINDYRDGCHLLNHDDVISTRRVSFILYLPDQEEWKPEWGGALELYPVSVAHEPEAVPTAVHPPLWNQFAFFPVIPGYSFHSVEEVVHPRVSRISISGWFHRPLPEEEGFSAEVEAQEEQARKVYSSAESLVSQKRTRPFVPYPDTAPAKEQEDAGAEDLEMTSAVVPGAPLSSEDRKFLSFFLNPAYLNLKVQSKLFDQFGDESSLLLADFLRPELSKVLVKGLVQLDRRDGFRWFDNKPEGQTKTGQELRDACTIQPHLTGVGAAEGTTDQWALEGPPHHHRFLALGSQSEQQGQAPTTLIGENPPLPTWHPDTAEGVLALLRTVLFPSPAFRAFLANVTQLIPLAARYPLWARRFRPGLDYTLAKKDEHEAVLQVNLGLTPNVADSLVGGGSVKKGAGLAAKKAKAAAPSGSLSTKQIKDLRTKWEEGVVGGWACFMAPAEDDDDPAVYGSGNKKPTEEEAGADAQKKEAEEEEDDDEEEGEGEEEEEEEEEEDFDGVLLSLTPQFNALNLVLRDEGVMHFVQYLSASAGGSRWDVEGEWRVGTIEDDEDEDEAEEAA